VRSSAFKMSRTEQVGLRWPTLGEHNEYVLKDLLHLNEDQIADALADGGITTEADTAGDKPRPVNDGPVGVRAVKSRFEGGFMSQQSAISSCPCQPDLPGVQGPGQDPGDPVQRPESGLAQVRRVWGKRRDAGRQSSDHQSGLRRLGAIGWKWCSRSRATRLGATAQERAKRPSHRRRRSEHRADRLPVWRKRVWVSCSGAGSGLWTRFPGPGKTGGVYFELHARRGRLASQERLRNHPEIGLCGVPRRVRPKQSVPAFKDDGGG